MAGEASEVLSIIRANELAQAALASTRDRLEKELAENKKAEAAEALAKTGKQAAVLCPEGGQQAEPEPSTGVVRSTAAGKQRSPSPPKATSKRRSKSVAPQGRRPITHQARANGVDI